MRVVLISHTCMSRTEGQPKASELTRRHPDVELTVLVPDRWFQYGQWRTAEAPAPGAAFKLHAESVRWPWTGPGQWYLHHYPWMKRRLLDLRPDIIDLWEEPWGLVSAQVCRLRNQFLPGTKIISETEQNVDKKLPPPFEWFRAYSLRNADYVIGRNSEAVGIVRRKGYRGPAKVVPNAVDAELFRPMNRSACRHNLDLQGFVVGYVGRLVVEKGLLELVSAIAACPSDVSLALVGEGPLQSEIVERAKAEGCSARVHFFPARPQSELPAVMNGFDVLVLPSLTTRRWKEQFGRVLIEASACAVPVIGSNSGAIPDVVGEGGIVIPEADVAALAAAIRRLRDNPDLARDLGAAGRRQVEAKYTWSRVADRMYEVYTECMSLNGGRIAFSGASA